MRALRRFATPVTVLVSGCSFPVDEFRDQPTSDQSDVGLTINGDVATNDNDDAFGDFASVDTGTLRADSDTSITDTSTVITDTGTAITDTGVTDTGVKDTGKPVADTGTCVCVKENGGGKCKEWSPPGCGDK